MEKKLEQLFYAVLGGALAIKDRVEASSEDLKACQERSEEHAHAFFDELAQRGEEEKDQFKKMLKGVLKDVAGELDLATRADLPSRLRRSTISNRAARSSTNRR
jgi:polyhydroxyalkanoate synthesis regulator phasin